MAYRGVYSIQRRCFFKIPRDMQVFSNFFEKIALLSY